MRREPIGVERPATDFKTWFLALDEGFTKPAVVLLIGADADDRWHVFRESYECGKLQSDVVALARTWFTEFGCVLAAVDSAAAGLIADLQSVGLHAVGGKGRVLDGIAALQNRLKVAGDGRPRLTVDPSCVNTVNEFESYSWKPERDVPIDSDNHSLDALRYLCDAQGAAPIPFQSQFIPLPGRQRIRRQGPFIDRKRPGPLVG